MKNELSGIWRQVSDFSETKDLLELGFINLSTAAQYVLNSVEEKYSFRRNRELIDISYRFRSFLYQGNRYIIKICKANEVPIEYYNALHIKEKLEKHDIDCIQIVCPEIVLSEANGSIGLLQEDYGYTLYENVEECRSNFEIKEILRIYRILLNLGIEWSGFLPRNLFFKNNKWYCIDFEDVYFYENSNWEIHDLTIFKLLLGWGQVFKKNEIKNELDKVLGERKYRFSSLDSFEKTLAELIDSVSDYHTRNFGFDITYKSELPVNSLLMANNYLSSMDIGHLMEDILDNNYLSVWYTVSTAKMRTEYGDDYYASFLNCFEHLLVVWLDESNVQLHDPKKIKQIQQISICLLIYYISRPEEIGYHKLYSAKNVTEIFDALESLNPCVASIRNFQRLQTLCGWSAAVTRSKCIHDFLKYIYLRITDSFPQLSEYDLLLRGSCAQGLMTIKSDVDFEISNEQKPYGFIAAENLLAAILEVFDIECEGSSDRPTEIDMVSTQGFTRDFHELCELITPGSRIPNKGWNNLLYNVSFVWKRYSEFELQKHNLSAKYLFFQIRAIIERYAIKYSITRSLISEILQELYNYVPNDEMSIIAETIQQCLTCYESNNINIGELIKLKKNIDYLYSALGVGYHD